MSSQTPTPKGLRATQEDRGLSSSEPATGAFAAPAVGPDERKQMEQSAENYPCNKEEQKQKRQSADQQQQKDGNQMGAGLGAPVGASTNTQVQVQQQNKDKDDENNSSKENSGRKRTTSEEQASRTREAVQRVYQMLEKHKPATSCDEADSCEDSTASSTASTASSSPRRGGGANARSQQQRGASGGSSSGYGGGGGGRGRQRRNNNSSRRNQQQSGAQHATSNECDSSYGSSSSLNSIRSSSTRMSSSTNDNYNETETEEEAQLARLRCPSECTEAISEREKRRRKRCADYPGFALVGGMGSIFASDTMMRFSIIQNELHNVINGQLKRV